MGKITLAVFVAALGFGVYWFWWSDQGANGPITVEGTLSITGMPALPGVQAPGKVDFTLQAMPNKLRIDGIVQKQRYCAIIRLDKREMYVLDGGKKTYSTEEFDFVDMDQTKPPEKWEQTWPGELKRTAEWDFIGIGDGKRFCNKQTMTGLPKEVMDATKAAPGGGMPGLPLAEMVKAFKSELWFTAETRLGRRYFGTLNKLARIREVGKGAKQDEKKPQFKYVNLDFFPIPMKAVVSAGPLRIEMDVKSFSRKRIPKDVFEVPSDYKAGERPRAGITPMTGPQQNAQPQVRPAPRQTVIPVYSAPRQQSSQPRRVIQRRTTRSPG